LLSRALTALMLAAVLSLLLASAATAATRYAAPGGTGKDPCADPARPCTVYTAAADGAPRTTIEAGDVVELAPGTYYAKEEGDFGYIPPVPLPKGVMLRGEPGKPRPVIVMPTDSLGDSAFYVPKGAEVANVEIRNLMDGGRAINISGGTIDGVIARSTITREPTCSFAWGIVRNSACIAAGGGAAISASLCCNETLGGVIRNSTLVATGPGSTGMASSFRQFKRGTTGKLDVVGSLIAGQEKDVVAVGLPLDEGRGARPELDLRGSRYATVEARGRVSVTPPGTNGNIRALPLLARDNLHQLPDSPTVDRGAVDGASGGLDIDGQPRPMGAGPDIGADELDPLAAPLVNLAPNTKLGGHVVPLGVVPGVPTLFVFGSSEIGSRFECKFDRRPYRACVSPFRRKVGPGKHALRVRAIDALGLADPTPATFRWQVQPRRAFTP
jgi:hypothetical protein